MKTIPGEIGHADLMKSLVPGLTPQMVGFLTSRKFHCASLFVDDRSERTFSHHQESTNTEETITTKIVCASEIRKCDKEVRHHHADNSTCDITSHKEEIENKKQNITFCGVGIHYYNVKAKNRIKIVYNPDRSMMVHAIHRRPKVTAQSLRPHAVSSSADVRNRCKLDKKSVSPLDKLITVKHAISLRNNHLFGCPCYVLVVKLQNHNSMPR